MYFTKHKTAISSALLTNNEVHYCAHLERVAGIQFTVSHNKNHTHNIFFGRFADRASQYNL